MWFKNILQNAEDSAKKTNIRTVNEGSSRCPWSLNRGNQFWPINATYLRRYVTYCVSLFCHQFVNSLKAVFYFGLESLLRKFLLRQRLNSSRNLLLHCAAWNKLGPGLLEIASTSRRLVYIRSDRVWIGWDVRFKRWRFCPSYSIKLKAI